MRDQKLNDDELLAELGIELPGKKSPARTPREERIIAGFEDVIKFYVTNNRIPQHGEERDIFERLYAVRLDQLRSQSDCHALLSKIDLHGLLQTPDSAIAVENLNDDDLLAELGVAARNDEADITRLVHVKSREEIRAAEDIANRERCEEFDKFRPLFERIQMDLDFKIREARPFGNDASIAKGEYFILGGQIAYVAEVGETIKAPNGEFDARLRVIFSNGTESNLLRRSLQRALYKDEAGRRITDPLAGPLFGDELEPDDLESGTIYVLRSLSDHPMVAEHRDLIHKIGVTGGSVDARIANAAKDATYMLAEVEIVATYKLANINRTKLEKIFHRVFASAQLNVTIQDRFGHPVRPREWFLVPLNVIDETVTKILDGTITGYVYDPMTATLLLS